MDKKFKNPLLFNYENINELLEKLQKNKIKDKNILISLYLPNFLDKEIFKTWDSLLSVEKRNIIGSEINKEEKEEILKLLIEIDEYLRNKKEEDYYHTLILFKSKNYFYSLDLAALLEKIIVISLFPYTQPLKFILDNKSGAIIAIIDREKSIFFEMVNDRFKKNIAKQICCSSENQRRFRKLERFERKKYTATYRLASK